MHIEDLPEIKKLSTPEKILLVEDLWDSIISDESAVPVPESHKEELNKRQASLQIGSLLSLEELKARVDQRK